MIPPPPLILGNVCSVSQRPDLYFGWPTLARRGEDLFALCSGFRTEHVCPFGELTLFRSTDGGVTWSEPRSLHDSTIDDRDGGLLVTRDGTLVAAWFTSRHWLEQLEIFRRNRSLNNPFDEDRPLNDNAGQRQLAWKERESLATPEVIERELGVWTIRSEDGGATWSAPVNSIVSSPHGPTELANGDLLFVGNDLHRSKRCLAVISKDEGRSWSKIGEIPPREGDAGDAYWEFHAVQANDGRVVAQVRNHHPQNEGETLQCESFDNGATWTPLHSIGVWGYPSHLLRLSNGCLLMTYGYRREGGAILVRISQDCGESWSEAAILHASFPSLDMGYPSTVEMPDGSFRSLWYAQVAKDGKAALNIIAWRFQ